MRKSKKYKLIIDYKLVIEEDFNNDISSQHWDEIAYTEFVI